MRTVLQHCIVCYLLLLSVSLHSQTTGYSGTGANIDVVYHRINWRINPDSATKAIKGSVTTYFKTMVDNVSTITFDLRRSAFSNANLAVTYHGASLPAASFSISMSNVLSINLGTTLALGTLDSVTVFYGGSPPAASGSAEGYQRATTPASQNYIYTLSESYEDRDWWPCKADMQDKVDSMDIIVSTPWVGADTFWVATNGRLIDSTIIGNSRIFTFKNRYPMASYLVCVSVARYNRYYSTINIGGTNVPVVYYLFRGKTAATYNTILTAMNKVAEVMAAFSIKFGDYPFKNEKHGFYEGLGGAGGMEHQTFSAIASSSISSVSTLTHELMHQWFGDKVTFSTWHHLWLAEGFARYSESLAGELVTGTGLSPLGERSSCKTNTLGSYATTSLVIPDASMSTSNGIWGGSYGGAVYDKGAMVVSMLRKLAGDTKFFTALRNYLNDPALAYKSATTDDLKNHFEAVLNYDLDPFFSDYASTLGKGNPAYDINWGSNGNNINIELTTQRRSTGSTVTYFRTPVVLKISNSGGTKDTTVVIYDQNNVLSYAGNGISGPKSGKVLGYKLSFAPASVSVDPDNETLVRGVDGTASQSTVTQVARLNINPIILLPINIIDVKASVTSNGNLLSLLVAPTTEQPTITLERSDDAINFYSLGNMIGDNSSSSGNHYSFLDKKIFDRTAYYYRVKIVDDKGLVNYSKTLKVTREKGEVEIKLSPNPAKDYITLSLPASWQNRTVNFIIYHSNGTVMKKGKIGTGNDVTIKLGNMPAGNYSIELISSSGRRVSKAFAVLY
jgi:hypothetical protein